MNPNEYERKVIAELVEEERVGQFVTKKAAYTEARINSQTWSNIEAGDPVKDYNLAKVVALLWPETRGNWRRIPGLERRDNTGSDTG